MKVRESVRNIELPKLNVPMIHGETDIVLKNIKTGLVERFHSENTFQPNVLRDQFLNMPDIKQNPLNNGTFSGDIQKALAGGLLLFKNAIEVGNYFMPAGNKMIGCGAKDTINVDLPTELGSYNSVESAEGNTSLTRVWDFATHQANGTIGCVCLTSGIAGYGGYGNPSGNGKRSNFNIKQYWQNTSADYWRHAENGFSYYFSVVTVESTKYLRIQKRRNLSDTARFFAGKSTQTDIELTNELDLGWNMWDDVCFAYYVGSGKFRLVPRTNGYTCASGGTFYYWEYDVNTETLSRKSFVNADSGAICGGYYFSYHESFNHPVFTRDGSIIIADGNMYYVLIIRLSDGAVIHKTSFVACNQYMNNRDFYAGQITDGLYMISIFANSSFNNPIMIVDTVNGTEYPSNWYPCDANTILNDFNGKGLCYIESHSNGSAYIGYSPLHLTTINNLQSPVTKTAAQTMKVTYTLTEA